MALNKQDKKLEEDDLKLFPQIPKLGEKPVESLGTPTTPNDIPRAVFNPDGSVTETAGGESVTLSAEQYKLKHEAEKAHFEQINPTMQADPRINASENLDKRISVGRAQGKTYSEIFNEMIAERQRQRQIPSATESISNLPPEIPMNQKISEDRLFGTQEALTTGTAGVGIAAGAVAAASGGAALPVIGVAAASAGVFALVKISSEKKQNVKQADVNRKLAEQNLKIILNRINKGLTTPNEAAKDFREQVDTLRKTQRVLKAETKTDLRAWLSNGKDELEKIEDFLNYDLRNYQTDIITAFNKPDPNKIVNTALEAEEATQ